MSHVAPDLVQKVLEGQDPLHTLGSGEQIRHYIYGGDLAEGFVTAVAHSQTHHEDFNPSNEQGTTVQQLARLIWRKIEGGDRLLRIVRDEPFAYDVPRRVPATGKAKWVLTYEATTTLDEMLDEVIPWIARAIEAGTI